MKREKTFYLATAECPDAVYKPVATMVGGKSYRMPETKKTFLGEEARTQFIWLYSGIGITRWPFKPETDSSSLSRVTSGYSATCPTPSGIKCGVDVVSYTTINITYREESKVRQTIGNDVQLHFNFKVIVVGRLT